jgi:F-type H+-transporting ATPase subunit gamma
MAKGIKELRRRIRGVKNIAQITRAMEMVASTKLKRLQERAEGSKPYGEALRTLVGRLAGKVESEQFPLLQKNTSAAIGVLIVTGDKGLCGAYHSNLFKAVTALIQQHPGAPIKLFVFGGKGRIFFRGRNPGIEVAYPDVVEKIPFVSVRDAVRGLVKRFLNGEIGSLKLVSTRFLSAAQQKPEVRDLLPIDPSLLLGDPVAAKNFDPILEPSTETIFERLLPKYLEMQVYGAVLEALASEFAMRRIAMKAATDAANDMISSLTRQYNRARQETITKELLEIVGGAEALKG